MRRPTTIGKSNGNPQGGICSLFQLRFVWKSKFNVVANERQFEWSTGWECFEALGFFKQFEPKTTIIDATRNHKHRRRHHHDHQLVSE